MLLGSLTILMMLTMAYAYLREGLMTSFMMCGNVIAAGLIALNFWEPIADTLDPMVATTILKGYEDAICLLLLFCITLGLLRVLTNFLCSSFIHFSPWLQYGGGAFFAMIVGYLVAGFLLVVFQTLPWHKNFMFFDYRYEPEQASAVVRRVLPPDRVWLSLMRRAGAYTFANNEDRNVLFPESFSDRFTRDHLTFDKYATFGLRYARYRRYDDNGNVLPYLGEFDREVHKPR